MSLLQLPLELLVLVTSHLENRDLARLLRVHSSLHNDILISELHKKDVEANGGLALCHYAHVGNEKGVRDILAAGAKIDLKAGGETALLKALHRRHTWIVRLLLAKGANPDLATINGTSPLSLAIETRLGDTAMLRLLLHYGANVNGNPTKGFHTPLFRAISFGDPAKVKLLLEHGAKASICDPTWRMNPLHTAGKVNANTEITRLLIEAGSGLNDHNREGKTPLQVAAFYSSVRVVEELLHQGADANLSSRYWLSAQEDGRTALFYATDPKYYKPRNGEIILRFLIWHGADVNKIDDDRLTALHLAAKNGSVNQARLLLDHGAQINPQAASSVLYLAAENNRKEMVAWLLARGADVNHGGQGSEPSICGAIRACGSNEDTSIIRSLLSAGANVRHKNTQGMTPLCLSADLNRPTITKLLIEQGADIHTKDNRGRTPLHKVVRHRDPAVTKMLIQYGADPNARDRDGYTPVHMAAQGHWGRTAKKTLRVLLDAGGNIHALSHNGKSPKDLVIKHPVEEDNISKFFWEYGA